MNSIEKQVISKQRVADHGEVYTSKREVRAMLDLVRQETERIESRFLEPACGTGNFLAEILERKLQVVARRYGKVQLENVKIILFFSCPEMLKNADKTLHKSLRVCFASDKSLWK